MVIHAGDTVAAVLRKDESLIDVFARLSPVFERLRDPDMGRVMARLVTVQQVARMAGIDPEELVRRLNSGRDERQPGKQEDAAMVERTVAPAAGAGIPPALEGISKDQVVEVDVREDLRAGREPFSRIMAALKDVPEGGALALRAIFEPVPLYAVLAKRGFTNFTERLAADDWRVWFYPAPRRPESPVPDRSVPDRSVVVLDVRTLEPPEPMVRTLAALDELPPGGTLVQLNVRVPQFLLPRLEERGYTYEIREEGPDVVRVFIRRGQGEHTKAEEHA